MPSRSTRGVSAKRLPSARTYPSSRQRQQEPAGSGAAEIGPAGDLAQRQLRFSASNARITASPRASDWTNACGSLGLVVHQLCSFTGIRFWSSSAVMP